MQKDQRGLSGFVLVLLGILIGLAVLAGWQISHSEPKTKTTAKQPTGCDNAQVQTLAKKDNLPTLKRCLIYTFETDTNEKITQVEIRFLTGINFYFLKDSGEIIEVVNNPYREPDFSLGTSDKACSYIWTNDLGAMATDTPDRFKRSMIKENGQYRWRFELTNFSGQSATDPNPPKCLRTGTLTTNLAVEDVKIIGTPEVQIK
jgi:hypothetical protein